MTANADDEERVGTRRASKTRRRHLTTGRLIRPCSIKCRYRRYPGFQVSRAIRRDGDLSAATHRSPFSDAEASAECLRWFSAMTALAR